MAISRWILICSLISVSWQPIFVSCEESFNLKHSNQSPSVATEEGGAYNYTDFGDYDYSSLEIPFCCDRHHYYDNGSCIKSNHKLEPKFHAMDEKEEKILYQDIIGFKNCTYFSVRSEEFKLMKSGDLFIHPGYTTEDFCLIWITSNDSVHPQMSALICFEDDHQGYQLYKTITRQYLYPTLMGISAFFLAMTFMVYFLVKDLQDLLGKALMCSVLSLSLSKVLSIVSLVTGVNRANAVCAAFGVAMHLGYLITFFWLNVISLIIFFSTGNKNSKMNSNKNWFLFSCIYAFAIPVIIISIMLIHDFTSVFDNSVVPKPGFGTVGCSFGNRGANIIYFYVPMAIILSVNVILFCFTAYKLHFLTKQSSVFIFQFKKYLKLFIFMGIPWVFELLSYFIGYGDTKFTALTFIWLIFDIINGLQGVIIFFAFIWRRSVLCRVAEVIFGTDFAKKKFPEEFQQQPCYETNDHYQLDVTSEQK